MFASSSQTFLKTSLMNMTVFTMSEKVESTSKSTVVYMAFPSWASLLTISSKDAYPSMASTNAPALPAFGATILFSLIVNDFGVDYFVDRHAL